MNTCNCHGCEIGERCECGKLNCHGMFCKKDIPIIIPKQCLECGVTCSKLPHPPQIQHLNEENLGYYLTAECCNCGSKVWLSSMRSQGLEKWTVTRARKLVCAYCSHELGFDLINEKI